MRVLYLTMNPNRASTTTPTEGWFTVLQNQGLEPVLVSNEAGAFDAWARAQGIAAWHIPMPVPSEFSARSLALSLWRLSRVVRRHRIQLIHCNEQDLYPVGQYLGRLCGLPVVVSVHFTMDRGFCRWAFGGSRGPRRIFFVSEGNREACRAGVEGIIPEAAWRVLPNGLDLDHFTPSDSMGRAFRARHGLGSHPVIGVACALRPRKQLEHLFAAAERLQIPDVRIVVAGGPVPGDEAYAAALLDHAAARLGSRLVVLGHLDELRGFYNSLDLFVNTSQEEACSISVIEALACGRPVVGYASRSVDRQILPDGGEIVEQDNVEQLTGALSGWLADPVRLHGAQAGARRTAEQRFDRRAVSQQLWREYQSVVSGVN